MAVTYSLAPIPKWYIADNLGRPAGGAKLYTKRQLNKDQNKAVYQDPNGAIPYTNPIVFDENGTEGPFFWEFDSTQPTELYYLRVTDSDDNLLYDIENYSPAAGGGGGSGTTYVNLKNLITNSVFWRNVGTSATPVPTTLTVCPSNHEAFEEPDMVFKKTSTANSDTITFTKFALGSDPFGSDITPNWYMNYQCTTNVPGETEKYLQIPITAKVNNLDNTTVTFTIWAQNSGAGGNITVQLKQYFGYGGGASANVLSASQLITVSGTWTKSTLTFVVPNTSGKTLGTTDSDALYLQINYPLSQQCNISIAKPSLYIGSISPGADIQTYDDTNAVICAPRTGIDIKMGYVTTAPFGYVAMNDGSIGLPGSNATTRANSDTFFLFAMIYSHVSNSFAPLTDSAGTPVARTNVKDDFVNNRRLTLPKMLGRTLASAGAGAGLTSRALGETVGEENHTLTISEMPTHDHTGSYVSTGAAFALGQTRAQNTGAVEDFKAPNNVAPQGGGQPHNTMQPTSFVNLFIKL